jgi:ABC-type multidrug transport system fused ATPase/permease subunit
MSWILEETIEEEKKTADAAKDKVEAGASYEMVNTNQKSEDGDDKKAPTINRSVHTLTDINLSIKQGQLVAIVGPVGCGKTSLISGLLGELHLKKGSINLLGSIAYCPQQAWILNQTLRDNVLFGLEYDEARFNRAIEVANLNADIAVLPAGVLTEIGERGINLR